MRSGNPSRRRSTPCRQRPSSACWKIGTSESWATGSIPKIDNAFSPEALRDALDARLGVSLASSFVVAFSGGVDSHVLLHALHALGAARLRAVHVDHALQPVSHAWSMHCSNVCAALGVPCSIERITVQRAGEESIEAAARRLRYERLLGHLAPQEVLLTAHHEDDQAETVLLALLRGTGVHGLASMPAIADFGAGRHARPLLGFSRAALVEYARACRLSWVEDGSNRDERLSRNFLRTRVLPELHERWPAAARTIARAATNSADAAAIMDEVAQADLALAGTDRPEVLALPAVRGLSAVRQRNLLRYWIACAGFQAPSARHLALILEQINRPSQTGHACVDWPGTEVRRYRDQLTVRLRAVGVDAALDLPWQPPSALDLPDLGWTLRADAMHGQGLSQARLAGASLRVRRRRGGESCRLVGRAHRTTLKKLLQEANVPPWEREQLPLIYVGNELAAIGDRWVCTPFAAGADEPGWQIVIDKPR